MDGEIYDRPVMGQQTIELQLGEIVVEHSMDGSLDEPDELKVNVYLPGAWSGFYIRSGAARKLAEALVALADEIDE